MAYLGLCLTVNKFNTHKHSLNLRHVIHSLSYTKASKFSILKINVYIIIKKSLIKL
jgi:hypothetical protein